MARSTDPLTEDQLRALRLYGMGYSVKEIGLREDRAPVTIEKRLSAARERLAIGTGRDAARAFFASGAADDYGSAIYGPFPLPRGLGAEAGIDPATTSEEHHEPLLHDSQPPLRVLPQRDPSTLAYLFRLGGRAENDRTPGERVAASLVISVAISLATALVLIAIYLLFIVTVEASKGLR